MTGRQLLHAYGNNDQLSRSLPKISARDIEALDDSNVLVKLIAITRLCWFMMNLLVRTLRKLPSSQLEIAVLAFSVSSLITYIILWGRPRNINRRRRIIAKRLPDHGYLSLLSRVGPDYLW